MTAAGHNSGGFLSLPKPPSTNGLYVNKKSGGRHKSERYLTWIRAAKNALRDQPEWRVDGPCVLDLTVQKRGMVREDISNRIKSIEDFLVEQGFIEDDRNVIEVTARWGEVDGCEVRCWPVLGTTNERTSTRKVA